jgi:DMSO/TMAO reductase YedYZ molybdopterin-dependent catalytic subunit
MFDLELSKLQGDAVAGPDGHPADVIISPDTRRGQRIPPGQSRTRKWPVLDAAGPPRLDPAAWKLEVTGLVERPVTLDWKALNELPQVKVFSDFHCVTRWSRLGNLWQGVATRALLPLIGTIDPRARYVMLYGYDFGWTTNLPIDHFLAEDSLIATHHDGEPISLEHGGPARLIVPQLYAWKSAKWLGGIEFMAEDKAGFWERNGYHMNGDPWKEERFGY